MARTQPYGRLSSSIILLLLVLCDVRAHIAVIYPQHDGEPPTNSLLAHLIMPSTLDISPLALQVAPWTQIDNSTEDQGSVEEVEVTFQSFFNWNE